MGGGRGRQTRKKETKVKQAITDNVLKGQTKQTDERRAPAAGVGWTSFLCRNTAHLHEEVLSEIMFREFHATVGTPKKDPTQEDVSAKVSASKPLEHDMMTKRGRWGKKVLSGRRKRT
jgi:hypothetical protein